jgi:hypothetical protein
LRYSFVILIIWLLITQLSAQFKTIEVQYGRSTLCYNFNSYIRFKPIDSYRLAYGWEQMGKSGLSFSVDIKQIGAKNPFGEIYNLVYIGANPSCFTTYKNLKIKAGGYLSYQLKQILFIKPIDIGINLSSSYYIFTIDKVSCDLNIGLMYSAYSVYKRPTSGFILTHSNMQNGVIFFGFKFLLDDN